MRTTTLVLLAVRFVDESTGFLAPASVEDFRADLGIGYGTAAAMFVSYGVGGVVGNIAVAATDGRSRKPVTVGGAATLALALLVLAGAPNGWVMLLGTGLLAVGSTGVVHGGEIAVANALADVGAGGDLERVLARGNLGAVAGDIAGPAALAALRAAGVDWRPVFVGAALLAAGYALLLAALEFPAAVSDPADRDVVPVRRQRLVWILALAAFVAMPLDEAYLATVLAFTETTVGWTDAQAAALGIAFVAGGVLAFTVLPGVVGRLPLERLFTASGVLLAAVMALAAGAPGWVLVPAGIAHSTVLNALWLGEQAVVLRANPGREGRTKLIVELLEGSSLLLVVMIGVLADRQGLRAAMWAFAALPLLLIVAAALRPSAPRPTR
jgi:MFS family permease